MCLQLLITKASSKLQGEQGGSKKLGWQPAQHLLLLLSSKDPNPCTLVIPNPLQSNQCAQKPKNDNEVGWGVEYAVSTLMASQSPWKKPVFLLCLPDQEDAPLGSPTSQVPGNL
jgi:hypothetical protein